MKKLMNSADHFVDEMLDGLVTAAAAKAVAQCRTIGVALSPCQIPGAAKPTFEIGPDEMEMGMGIHGEPGIWRDKLRPADSVAEEMIDRLLADPVDRASPRVSLLVNSLGATPLEELFILYRRAAHRLAERGITVVRPLVGSFVTSMEMAGCSISLLYLDDELEDLLAAPAECPFWKVS